jgi:hypothetical protein
MAQTLGLGNNWYAIPLARNLNLPQQANQVMLASSQQRLRMIFDCNCLLAMNNLFGCLVRLLTETNWSRSMELFKFALGIASIISLPECRNEDQAI